jgi:probable rRNA maturation factor
LIKDVQSTDSNFSGKTAKISGGSLNKKNIQETLDKLSGGALIVQGACAMTSATVENLHRALEQEDCPYEANVAVLLTDNEGIHAMNKEFREIDRPTDVLSFPNVDYEAPADFTGIEDYVEDYFDPETGELILGDIVISVERAREQAKEVGNSTIREICFLAVHSTLHLLGYDHERSQDDDEAQCLAQREIMDKVKF